MKKKQWILLVAGGTGGHMFPAQSLSKELQNKGYAVGLITDKRGQAYVREEDFTTTWILTSPRFDGSIWKKFWSILQLLRTLFEALALLRKIKPCILWGFGGYATVAPLLAAQLCGIPKGIHQADAVFGRANRWITRLTRVVVTASFAKIHETPHGIHVVCTGLPVRQNIEALSENAYVPPDPTKPFRLCIIGGSQGSAIWSRLLPQAVKLLSSAHQARLHISQQCRPELMAETQEAYKKTSAEVVLAPFWAHIDEILCQSHLVISRAGASILAELAASGRPVLLVPYPYAMDDHQTYNAQKVVACGGGWMIQEKILTAQNLALFLQKRLENPEDLEKASLRIRQIYQKNAVEKLGYFIETCIRGKK